MVTTNLPFGRGGEAFSDDVVAAQTMVGCLVHLAEVLTVTGDSFHARSRREVLVRPEPEHLSFGGQSHGMISANYYNLDTQWRALAEQRNQIQVEVDVAYPDHICARTRIR